MNLLAELKRRNVLRMAGLYLVGAWLLTQVSSTVLPMFDAPGWLPRGIVIALAVGFIPALIFSWVFELTPQGLKRDEDVLPEQSIAPQTARRMDRMIIVVLLLALTYFGFDKFVLAPQRGVAASGSDAHSIAVLPFVNMSGEAQNEYFSDGIAEEILNVLARSPELRVAARTSSFSFKRKTLEVPEIARALNVRMVLEGSVRKQNDRVRITAQLIDANSGYHVWSQTYDRKLEDIFAIQDEIAKAIGTELEVKLAGPKEAGKPSAGTRDLAAYDLYLRGIALWQTRREDALWQAIDLFEQAIVADPQFAQAYAGLALVYSVLPAYSGRIGGRESLARSDDAAKRALALDPTLPEIYAAMVASSVIFQHRETAIALARRAIVLRPSFATAHQWLGSTLWANGDTAAALASLEMASRLDPLSPVIAENHAFALLSVGRPADARERCLQLLAVQADYFSCLEYVGLADLMQGNYDAARPVLERLAQTSNPSALDPMRTIVDAVAGRGNAHALAQRMAVLPLNSLLDPQSGNAFEDHMVPVVLVLLGEQALALDFIERNAEEFGNNMDWTIRLPSMDPIRCDPRFVAVVKKLQTTDPYFAKVCAGKN